MSEISFRNIVQLQLTFAASFELFFDFLKYVESLIKILFNRLLIHGCPLPAARANNNNAARMYACALSKKIFYESVFVYSPEGNTSNTPD